MVNQNFGLRFAKVERRAKSENRRSKGKKSLRTPITLNIFEQINQFPIMFFCQVTLKHVWASSQSPVWTLCHDQLSPQDTGGSLPDCDIGSITSMDARFRASRSAISLETSEAIVDLKLWHFLKQRHWKIEHHRRSCDVFNHQILQTMCIPRGFWRPSDQRPFWASSVTPFWASQRRFAVWFRTLRNIMRMMLLPSLGPRNWLFRPRVNLNLYVPSYQDVT